MRIELDDKHWLNGDSQCYWVSGMVEVTRGKDKGTMSEKRLSGYARTFSEAVDSFIEASIRTAEIEDFRKLAETVEELKKTVRGWEVNLTRG